jgi:hypothetical protein
MGGNLNRRKWSFDREGRRPWIGAARAHGGRRSVFDSAACF